MKKIQFLSQLIACIGVISLIFIGSVTVSCEHTSKSRKRKAMIEKTVPPAALIKEASKNEATIIRFSLDSQDIKSFFYISDVHPVQRLYFPDDLDIISTILSRAIVNQPVINIGTNGWEINLMIVKNDSGKKVYIVGDYESEYKSHAVGHISAFVIQQLRLQEKRYFPRGKS